jgi:hypothetical protein
LLHQFIVCLLSQTNCFKESGLWKYMIHKSVDSFLVGLIFFFHFAQIFPHCLHHAL